MTKAPSTPRDGGVPQSGKRVPKPRALTQEVARAWPEGVISRTDLFAAMFAAHELYQEKRGLNLDYDISDDLGISYDMATHAITAGLSDDIAVYFINYWAEHQFETVNLPPGERVADLRYAIGAAFRNYFLERFREFAEARLLPKHAEPSPTPLPVKAPVFWQQGRWTGENPAAFVSRVYREWIGRGLTRAHLLQLDKPLYVALSSWLQRKGNDLWFELPTKKEENDKLIKKMKESPASVPVSEYERLTVAMKRRRKTDKNADTNC